MDGSMTGKYWVTPAPGEEVRVFGELLQRRVTDHEPFEVLLDGSERRVIFVLPCLYGNHACLRQIADLFQEGALINAHCFRCNVAFVVRG